MGDSDGEEAPNLGALRRDREVLTNKIMKIRDKMYKELEETPAELDVILARDTEAAVETLLNEGHSINDRLISVEADPAKLDEDDKSWDCFLKLAAMARKLCKRVVAIKEVCGKIQTTDHILSNLAARRLEEPGRDYSIPVKRIAGKVNEILQILEESTIPADHDMRKKAMELEIKLEDMEIVDSLMRERGKDTKDSIKEEPDNPYKLAHLQVPRFSGKMEDWVPFWIKFLDPGSSVMMAS